jgi:linoleoyl-CoA desaturase
MNNATTKPLRDVPPPISAPSYSPDFAVPQPKDFSLVLRQRFDRYFTDRGIAKSGNVIMAVKVAVGLALCAGTYALLCIRSLTSGQFVVAYLLYGLAQLFLLLNVAHDANHYAISSRRHLGNLLCLTFDLFGINSYIWRAIHNSSHHNNINVYATDLDVLGRGPFVRFSPDVPRRAIHRFQHFYAWVLYGFSTLEYVLFKDFEYFFYCPYEPIRRMPHTFRQYAILFSGKLFSSVLA